MSISTVCECCCLRAVRGLRSYARALVAWSPTFRHQFKLARPQTSGRQHHGKYAITKTSQFLLNIRVFFPFLFFLHLYILSFKINWESMSSLICSFDKHPSCGLHTSWKINRHIDRDDQFLLRHVWEKIFLDWRSVLPHQINTEIPARQV